MTTVDRSRLAVSPDYPRWTVGEVEAVQKRLRRLEVDEPDIQCFLDHMHAVAELGEQRPGGSRRFGIGALTRRSRVTDTDLLVAVESAAAVRKIHVVSAGLPTLGAR